jgi:transposase InsO family protein
VSVAASPQAAPGRIGVHFSWAGITGTYQGTVPSGSWSTATSCSHDESIQETSTPGAIHHSDAGRPAGTAVAFATRLQQLGLRGSIGSVGDAYDNALAEATNGLYKTECIQPGSPFHHGLDDLADLELATAGWVHWYNTRRLMHRLGLRSPLHADADYYADHTLGQPASQT